MCACVQAAAAQKGQEVRELNHMLQAWEAMRLGKDAQVGVEACSQGGFRRVAHPNTAGCLVHVRFSKRPLQEHAFLHALTSPLRSYPRSRTPNQIAALMERCKRLEEKAAEKGRTADALRRKLAFSGAGGMGSGPPSVASYSSAAAGAGAAAGSSAAHRPASAASLGSYAAGGGSVGSLRVAAAGGGYSHQQQPYAGSPRSGVLSGGVGAGIVAYSGGSSGYHSPTKLSALLSGTLGAGVLGTQSPGGSSCCSAGGAAALRRSWGAAGSPGAASPAGQGAGFAGL